MKILMVSPQAYPPYVGGVETHLYDISRFLVKKGHHVEIYSTDPSGKLSPSTVINGVRMARFFSWAPWGLYHFSPKLFASLKNAQACVIHAHDYRSFPMLAAALAKAKNKTPLVITLHLGASKVGRMPYLVYNPIFGNLIFHRADKIVVVSKIEVEYFRQLKKMRNKIIHIPNGIDLDEVSKYKRKVVTNESKIRILYAGRLERKKGISYLLKAFNKVVAHHDVDLWIVGDGPLKSELIDIIKKQKMNGKVHLRFNVSRDELYGLYARAHIFVLLSQFEAHSIALTEAMAFGLVPVATNVGGNAYLVNDGKDGFLVKYPPSINEISQILVRLINDSSMRKEMSKCATENSQRFNIENCVSKLENLYQCVLRM